MKSARLTRSEQAALLAVAGLMVVWVVVGGGTGGQGSPGELPDALRWLRGLLPAAAIAVFVRVELQLVRRLDEFERRIQLEALAFAYPTALLIAIGLRFLHTENLLVGWQLAQVWPLLALPYFVGLLLARRRYR